MSETKKKPEEKDPEKEIEKKIRRAFEKLGITGWYTVKQIMESGDLGDDEEKVKEILEKQYKTSSCKKGETEKYGVKELPTLLLVGNGPNLVDAHNGEVKWDALLKKLEKCVFPSEKEKRAASAYQSFPLRMQAILNLYKLEKLLGPEDAEIWGTCKKIKMALEDWFEGLGKLLPTAVHRILANFDFDYYLTTNYDLALDRALDSKTRFKINKNGVTRYLDAGSHMVNKDVGTTKTRKRGRYRRIMLQESKKKRVTHIHGSVRRIQDIVMTPTSYMEAANELRELEPKDEEESWLRVFCHSEVHICGLELRPEESLVWYALEKRAQEIRSRGQWKIPFPRAYVYLFHKDEREDGGKDLHEKQALVALLKTYSAKPILITVYHGDYLSAWKQLMGEMMLNRNKYQLQNRAEDKEEDGEENEEEPQVQLPNVERRGYNRNSNQSNANTSHHIFPYHACFSLSEKKIDIIEKEGCWLSYCRIENIQYMYSFEDAEVIRRIVKNKNKLKKRKVSLLLDYKRGYLYIVDKNNAVECIGKGTKHEDLSSFCAKFKKHSEKTSS